MVLNAAALHGAIRAWMLPGLFVAGPGTLPPHGTGAPHRTVVSMHTPESFQTHVTGMPEAE